MSQTAELSPFLRGLFRTASDGLLALYQGAADNANLLHADFYTLRDLLELSGYEAAEPVHVLVLALLLALDEGSLCVEASADGLSRRLAGLVEPAAARDWAQRAAAALDNGGLPALIGRPLDENRPVLLLEDGDCKYLYFQKYLRHEMNLTEVLRKRLATAQPPAPGDLAAILRQVLDECPLRIAGRPLRLNLGQQTAVGLVLLRSFVIVSGGPGTGKTSIVVSLLRCLVRCGIPSERIALAAPTGRAAQRLTDAVRLGLDSLECLPEPDRPLVDLTARTLHQLLRYRPGRGSFLHHAENPLAADVVIVDEVSMVGVRLMAQLFQALRPETRLVLLGDKDQLSSIDPGAVLAHLVPADFRIGFSAPTCADLTRILPEVRLVPDAGSGPLHDVRVVLEDNYRSQPEIQAVARAINASDPEIAARLPRLTLPASGGRRLPATSAQSPDGAAKVLSFAELSRHGGCWLLEKAAANRLDWQEVLEQWAHHHYLGPSGAGDYRELVGRCVASGPEGLLQAKATLDAMFALLHRGRILSLVREGPWGCEGINRFLGQLLRPRLDANAGEDVFAGLPVLITRNDHTRQLYNGDVGLVLRGTDGGHRVLFSRPSGYVALPADSLPAHEPAFALTVHKSQGSEYDEVLLVLPPEGGQRLLTKEMVYTGITRARRLAVVAGSAEVLASAIARRVERESALLNRIQ